MTIGVPRFPMFAGLLADEDVLPQIQSWRAEGRRTALVTLVGVEGGAPRQPGAQMAVADDGRYVGYLSGGCLEQAVALEARDVIASGKNRLVRYGKGSPYFDITLPCGSGLDLYFDQGLDGTHLAAMETHRAARQSFALRTDISSGGSSIEILPPSAPVPVGLRTDGVFQRVYAPPLQLLLLGNGPGLVGIATIAAALGLETKIATSDNATQVSLAQSGLGSILGNAQVPAAIERLDFASGAVLVFHEHEKEHGVLRDLLGTQCFYIGVLGTHAVHRDRLAALAREGVSPVALGRLRAPVGSIPAAKSKATLAVSVLAEMIAEAKALNLVP
jgi:xanthine dehydrogenase accessory factor